MTSRGVAVLFLTFALAFAALWWVGRDIQWQAFAGEVRYMHWKWIAAAVLFDVLSYVAQGWRWQALLRREGAVSLGSTTRAIYAGLFLNEVAPMRPGEALRAWLIAKELKSGVWKMAPSIVTERLLDGLVLSASLLFASSYVPLPHPVLTAIRILAAICTVGVIIIMALRREGSLRALAGSVASLLGQGLAYYSVVKACGLDLGLTAGLIVMLVVRIGTMLPGAPANIGTHQLATVLGLSLFGISKSAAAPFSMIVFAVLTIPLWLLGMLALGSSGVQLKGLRGSLQAA